MNYRIDQDKLIKQLNAYLQWHNMPLQMNNEGICNGLTSVYVKYALDNKEQEFLELLQYIADKQPDSEMEY